MKPGFPNYDWQRKRGQVRTTSSFSTSRLDSQLRQPAYDRRFDSTVSRDSFHSSRFILAILIQIHQPRSPAPIQRGPSPVHEASPPETQPQVLCASPACSLPPFRKIAYDASATSTSAVLGSF